MIEYEDITAKWARETAQKVTKERVQLEVEDMLDLIKDASNSGELVLEKATNLEIESILELRDRGFEVIQTDEQRDGYWLVIKW
jgi:hypothetical protein